MNPNSFDEIMKVQRMMASRVMTESSMNEKIKLLELIRNLAGPSNKKIQIEQILYETQIEGFLESEVIKLLDELKNDNLLVDVEDGYVQLI